jgi:hypothetical protein
LAAFELFDCDEDFDEVSALTASSAVAAAPRANSIGKLRQLPHHAVNFSWQPISKHRATTKNPMKFAIMGMRAVPRPRQLMPPRQNFPRSPVV